MRGLSVQNTMSIRNHSDAISDISCGSSYCVTGDDSGSFCVFSVNDTADPGSQDILRKLHYIESTPFPCTSLKVFDDTFVASFTSGHIRFYDSAEGTLKCEVAAHSRCITSLDASIARGSKVVCSVGEDSCMSVWTVPSSSSSSTEHSEEVERLYYDSSIRDKKLTGVSFITTNHGERKIIVASYDNDTLDVWDEK